MTSRIAIKPELLRWARERARLDLADLAGRFPKIAEWEGGQNLPTFKQLEAFANAVHVPFGYLFLPEPPSTTLPIRDFRTVGSRQVASISPDLLDTIHAMQRRQAWLHEDRQESEAPPLEFVGSARLTDSPAAVGREMRRLAGLADGWAAAVRNWQDALARLRQAMEGLGIMIVVNGIVGNNTRRRLDVEEFRGFALCSDYAPLIFVNGADSKSAQMFTLAHELAHIWLGEAGAGLSGFPGVFPAGSDTERFCDKAAAEFLAPEAEVRACWPEVRHADAPFEKLAKRFKVSPIVAGRRALDLRLVDRQAFFDFYAAYTQQERKGRPEGGGDFYKVQNNRIGQLFATQVIRAAMEGRITFKRAYDLTGLTGGSFQAYARRLGHALP